MHNVSCLVYMRHYLCHFFTSGRFLNYSSMAWSHKMQLFGIDCDVCVLGVCNQAGLHGLINIYKAIRCSTTISIKSAARKTFACR